MSPPPTSIDGTDITGATIDGQKVEEITIDGQTVFTATQPAPQGGLKHNYDPSQLSGFSDGDTVSTRPDQTGTDDITGSGIYRTSGIGGQPTIEYNASANHGHSGSFATSLTPSFHVFTVSNISTSGSNETIWSESSGFTVKDAGFDGPNNWFIDSQQDSISSVTYTSGDDDIVLIEYNDNPSMALRVNGTDKGRSNVGGTGNLPGISLAKDTVGNPFDQLIAQVLIYDSDDPNYSRSNVESFLSSKYTIPL